MSRTSDPQLESVLAEALQAGMSDREGARWRKEIDPVTLDTCGCRASARTSAVAVVVAALVALALGTSALWTLVAAAATALVAALVGKIGGSALAGRQRLRLLGILRRRVEELAGAASHH
jgi:hypothetical protein